MCVSPQNLCKRHAKKKDDKKKVRKSRCCTSAVLDNGSLIVNRWVHFNSLPEYVNLWICFVFTLSIW